jgi:hypothetical protein
MKSNHPKFLAFNKKDRIRFLQEFEKLSTKAKSALKYEGMDTWDGFYYHFLIIHNIGNFRHLRGVGNLTQLELIDFTRIMLNPDGQYSKELEKFEFDLTFLSPNAISALGYAGINLFETFYYRLIIEKEYIDFKSVRNCGELTRPEVEGFVESFCSFLGARMPTRENTLYFNPNNPKIPFVADTRLKNEFRTEFEFLSKTTKSKLIKIEADNIDGFYTAFISPKSPFNSILNEFGEQTLIELLRFRTSIKEYIKDKKDSPQKNQMNKILKNINPNTYYGR